MQIEQFYTPEEYLAFERNAEERHEYIKGEIVAMSGASRRHNLISGNVAQKVRNQLEDQPCETYASDMRVRSTPMSYTYPDVVIVCGEPQFEESEGDTLLNPTVIIEVLSKSTEARDRGAKLIDYQTITSLTDYILIAQDHLRVEHYARQSGGEWRLQNLTQTDAQLVIHSIGVALSLGEIYRRIAFPPPAPLHHVEDESQES